tara:strand:+ start:207 stop:383 length:177 start_codon:yes stop_codon:yes gene_type:complete
VEDLAVEVILGKAMRLDQELLVKVLMELLIMLVPVHITEAEAEVVHLRQDEAQITVIF